MNKVNENANKINERESCCCNFRKSVMLRLKKPDD